MNHWRVGRSLGRTLYIMRGDEASKDDTFVGVVDTKGLAEFICRCVNNCLDSGVDPGLLDTLGTRRSSSERLP